jgi:tetratricopeptide (TPR) repeat protein
MNIRATRVISGSLLTALLLLLNTQLLASVMDDDIAYLQHEWARIKYQTSDSVQEKLFAALATKAREVAASYPGRAEPLVWEGIIYSTWAGAKGGIGALSLVKESRKQLEAAIAIDPAALQGSAYTSLGTLYFKVPGWPIGFGDTEKAEKLLKQALAINPNGIDPNYFYGEFLLEEDRYSESVAVLSHALEAAPRPDRPIADAGRKAEIHDALERARKHLE